MHPFLDDPILTAGYDYWRSLPSAAGVPDRCDLDPLQMPKQLFPNVALVEIIENGADGFFRLSGHEFDTNFGFSLKGKRISGLSIGDYRDYILAHLAVIVDEREAVYSESAFRWDRGGQRRTRRLLMPLSAGEPGVIAMIFAVQTWPRDEMRGLPFYESVKRYGECHNSEPQLVHPTPRKHDDRWHPMKDNRLLRDPT